VKCHGGSGKDRGVAERGGQDMEESANKGTERRMDAFTAASGELRAKRKKFPARGDGQHQSSSKEKQETVGVEHPEL